MSKRAEGEPAAVSVPEPRQSGRLKWRPAGEVVPDFWEPGLIDGVLETHGLTIVYGPSGSGKTAIVVDLALRVAAGMDWCGHLTQQGAVIYVAAENYVSTERRVWAWCQRHGVEGPPLAVVETGVVMSNGDVDALARLAKEVAALFGCPVRLIVVDTLARTMHGNENETEAMGAYVACAEALKERVGAHVMIVHHTGKDEARGARGSSALKAATDHELEVYRAEGKRGLMLTKVREGELEGTGFGFELERRVLGVNRMGREVSTVVAVADGDGAPRRAAPRRSTQAEEAVEAFFASAEGLVTVEQIRAGVTLSTGNSSSERQAWKRLLDKGFVSVDGDGIVTLT